MNAKKKLKLLSISFLGMLFALTLASCGKSETITGGSSPSNSGITDEDSSFTTSKANVSESGFNFDTARLSSTNINVSKAKTTFFLGEEFTSEGVVVEANYMQNINGENKVETLLTTDFTVDSSKVDMFNIGTYPVEVTYRNKATVYTKTYSIKVISSELSASGEEYVGGVDVLYKGEIDYTIDLGGTFDANLSNFAIVRHYFVGDTETSSKTITSKYYSTDGSQPVKIDLSSIDVNTRGDYIVSVEYTPDDVVLDSKTISYTVKAFIIVHVSDPITNVEFVSGTQTFAASPVSFDYSDWTFRVTRKNSGVATVKYNKDDFVITGIVPFVAGSQKANLKYMDYKLSLNISITVTPSTTFDIYKSDIYDTTEAEDGSITCSGEVWTSNYVSESTTETVLDSSGLFKICKAKYENRFDSAKQISKDSYGSLYFGYRATVKGAGSYISFTMTNPGKVVIYAATTGTDQRDVSLCSVLNSEKEEDCTVQYTSDQKQQILQFEFEVTKAGSYYIQSFTGGIYVHGIVLAMSK